MTREVRSRRGVSRWQELRVLTIVALFANVVCLQVLTM